MLQVKIVLDESIRHMRNDPNFIRKVEDSILYSHTYSARFVYNNNVFKRCQMGNGTWKVYLENGGLMQTSLMEA